MDFMVPLSMMQREMVIFIARPVTYVLDAA